MAFRATSGAARIVLGPVCRVRAHQHHRALYIPRLL